MKTKNLLDPKEEKRAILRMVYKQGVSHLTFSELNLRIRRTRKQAELIHWKAMKPHIMSRLKLKTATFFWWLSIRLPIGSLKNKCISKAKSIGDQGRVNFSETEPLYKKYRKVNKTLGKLITISFYMEKHGLENTDECQHV